MRCYSADPTPASIAITVASRKRPVRVRGSSGSGQHNLAPPFSSVTTGRAVRSDVAAHERRLTESKRSSYAVARLAEGAGARRGSRRRSPGAADHRPRSRPWASRRRLVAGFALRKSVIETF